MSAMEARRHLHCWWKGNISTVFFSCKFSPPRSVETDDPFYDRGSTFPLFCFWKTGFLYPKSSECQPWFRKTTFRGLGPWDYSPRCVSIFAEVNCRARYVAPYVRSIGNFRVNLYGGTPLTVASTIFHTFIFSSRFRKPSHVHPSACSRSIILVLKCFPFHRKMLSFMELLLLFWK